MKNLFPLLCFALLASACGKKDDQSVVVGQPVAVGPYPAPPAGNPPPQILGQYPYFYVNYKVDEASCSTGWRRFSGNSYEYVKARMCDSFRNNSMNQNCGQTQREAWYQSVCAQGY
jgi:hypothetical protein